MIRLHTPPPLPVPDGVKGNNPHPDCIEGKKNAKQTTESYSFSKEDGEVRSEANKRKPELQTLRTLRRKPSAASSAASSSPKSPKAQKLMDKVQVRVLWKSAGFKLKPESLSPSCADLSGLGGSGCT